MRDRHLNPLGFPVGGNDHEPMMVVGRGADGTDRWIDEVKRGLACGCTCLECGNRLVARQGKVREWSFAHTMDSNCSGGIETQAHRFAKTAINAAGGLYVASAEPNGWGVLHPHFIKLTQLRIEQRIAGFRADLVGSLKDRELIIEVKVTHGCSRNKIAAYRELNASVLEIDLGPFRYKTEGELRNAVIKEAPRHWLSLSNGRAIPREPPKPSVTNSATKARGLYRPRHIPARVWDAMSTLDKLTAIDPDGRLSIKSRGYRG